MCMSKCLSYFILQFNNQLTYIYTTHAQTHNTHTIHTLTHTQYTHIHNTSTGPQDESARQHARRAGIEDDQKCRYIPITDDIRMAAQYYGVVLC